MTPSKDHLSNVDISTVYLGILNITLHKINQNIIVSLHQESMQSPPQREILDITLPAREIQDINRTLEPMNSEILHMGLSDMI